MISASRARRYKILPSKNLRNPDAIDLRTLKVRKKRTPALPSMGTFMPDTFHRLVDHDPLQPRLVHPHGPDSGPIFSDAFGRLPGEAHNRRHPSARDRRIEVPPSWGDHSPGYRRRPHDSSQPSRRDHTNPVSDSKKAETTKKDSVDPKQIQVTIHIHGTQNSAATPKMDVNKASKIREKVKNPSANKEEVVKNVEQKPSGKPSDGVRIAHFKNPSHSILRKILDGRPIVIIRNNVATSEKNSKVTSSKTSPNQTQSTGDKVVKSKRIQSVSTVRSSSTKESIVNTNHLKHSSVSGDIKPSHNNAKAVDVTAAESQRRRALQHKAKTIPKDFASRIPGKTNQGTTDFQNEHTNSIQKVTSKSSKENYHESQVKTVTSSHEKRVFGQNVQQDALFDGNSSAIEYSVLSDTQGSKYVKGNFARQAKFSSKEETLKSNIHERGDTSSKKTKPLNTITPDRVNTMYNVNTRDPKQDFRKVIDKQTAKHVSQLSTSVTAEGPSLYETQRVGNLYHAKNQNKDVKKKTIAIHDTSQQSQHVKPHAGVAHKSAAFQNENLVAAKETRQYLNSNPYPEQIQQQVKSSGQLQTGSAVRTQANYDPVLLSLLAMMIQKDARRSDNQQGGQSKSKHNHITQTNSEILSNVNNKELHIPVSVLEQLQLRGINVSGAGISPEGSTGSGLQKSVLKEEMQSRQNSQSRVLTPKYEANAFKTKIVLEVPKTSIVSKYEESIGTTRDFHALENPIKANTHNMKASTGNQATRESQSMNPSKSGSAALKKESQMDHQTGTTYPPLSHKTEIKGPVIHTKISVETHLIDPNQDTKHKNQQTHTPYEPAVDMNISSAKDSLDTADKQYPAQGLISKVHTINSKQEFHSSQHQFPSRSLSRNLKEQAKNSVVEARTKALIPETWLQSKTREEKHQTEIAYPQSAHETHYSSKKQHKTSGSKVYSSPYTSQIHEQYVSGSLINPLGSAKDQQASKTNYNTMTQQGKPGSIFSESGNNPELNIQQPMQAVPVVTATQRKTFKPAVPKLFSSQGHIQSMDGVQVGQSDLTAKQKMQPIQYTSQLLHDTSERGMNGQGSATTGHDQQASHISETNKYYVGEGQLHQKLSAGGPNTQHFPPHLQNIQSKVSHVGSHTLGSNTNLDIQQTQYSIGNPSHNLHGVSLHQTHQRQHNQLATYDSQIKQKIPESNQPTKKSSETFSQETSYALQSNSPLLQDYASESNAMEKYGNGPSNPAMNVETNLQVTSYTFLSSDLNLHGHGTASKVTQAIAQNSNQPSVRDTTQPRDGTIKTIVSTSGSNRQVSDAKQSVEFSKHNSKMAKNNLTVSQSHISQDHMQGISTVKEHQTGTSRMQSKEPTHYSRQVQHDTSGSRHDQQASYISQTSDAYLGVGLSHHKVSAADPKTQHSISHSQANPERVNVAHQTSDMIKVIQKSSGSLGTQSHDLSGRALHQVLTSEASPNTQHSNMQANADTLHAVRHTEGSNIGQSVQRLLSSSGGINRDLGGSSVHQLPSQKQIQMAAYFQTHQKAHTPNQHVPSHPKDSFHKSLPGFSGSQDQITVYTEGLNDGQKSSLLTKSLATNHHDTSSNSLFDNLSSQQQAIESQGTLIVGQKSNQAVKHVTTHPKVTSHSLHSNIPNSLRHSVLSKESHYIEKMSNQPMSASTHPQDVSFSNNPGFRGHATVSNSTHAVEGSPYHSQISQHDLSGSVDYQTLSAGTQQQFAKHNNVHSADKWASPVPTQHIKLKYNPSKGSVHSQTASDVQQKIESIGLLKPKNFTPQSFAKTENQEKAGASHTKSSPYQTQTNNHVKPNKKDGTIASKYNSHSHTLNIGRSATLQVGTGTTQHEHYQAIGAPGNIQTGSAHPSHVKQSTYIASSGILQTGSAQPSHVQHSHHIAASATSQNDILQHNDQLRQYTAASEITQKDPAKPSHAEHNLYMALLQAGSTQPSSFKENHHIAASGTIKTNMLQPSQTQKGVHKGVTEVGTPQTNTALQSHIQQDHQIVGPERTLVGMAQHYAQPRQHTAASETIQTNPVQPSHVPQTHDMVPLGTLKAGNGQTSSVRLSHYDAAPGTKEIGTLHIQHSMHNAAVTPLTDIALLRRMQQSHQIVGPGTIQAGMVQQNTQSSGTIQTDIAQPVHVPQKQHFIASRTSQAGMTHPRYDQPVVSGTTYSGSAQQSQAHESIKISKPGTLTDSMSQHKAQSGQNIKTQSKILQARNIQPSHIQQSQHSAAKGILHPGNKQPVALGTLQAGVTHSSNNHQSHNIAVQETSYSDPAQLSQGQQSHKITSQRTIQARMSQTNVQTNQYMTPSGALQAGNTKPGHVQQSQHNVARGTIHPGNTQPSHVQEIQHILSTGTLQPGQTQPNQIKRSSQISGSVVSQPDLSSQSQQSYYKVDTGNFQAVSSQLGGIQQSQHVAALETSHAAQPNHFKTISRSSTSGTSQPGYAQSQHKTPSATFQSVSAQLNYAQPRKNVAASGKLNAYLAQPSTISQHSPASWSQNAGSTQHAQQEQRNQLTGTNHDAGIQKIYNMPDTLKAPKHGIPASWSQSSEGIGSQYFQLPNNTQRKNLIFHRQQEQRGAPGKSTDKHSSAVNMIHYAQPNDANNNQQSIYGTNQNNFVSQLPGKGAVSIQHSNLYPTDQYNAHGLQRNTTSSVSPMNVDQHNLRRTRGNQQTSIPGKLSQESQPYRQQSTAQDVFISRQLNTSLSNINQHSSSGSLNLAHDLMQHFKKDRQKSMHLAQDPQHFSHFSGHSDVSSQSQTHSNQEPGKHKLHHDRQVNNHKLDASKGQGTPQNDPFLNQQPAAKQLSGPYHSQQHIHQQFDSQNVGPSTVNRLGEMAVYQNKQGQFNLESGANQLDLYQSKTHLDREFHGQQLQQHGQVNPYAAAAFKIHGTGKNYHYSNQQPAAKRSKMQSSGPHQNQQQIYQQFDMQNYGSSAAHRAGIEALYHNTQGQSNLGSGLRQQDFYPSNIHSNREHSVQHLQGLSLNGKANGHTGSTSKVGGTSQNDPYLNKQLTTKRSKIQSSEPFQSQYQTGLQFNHEKIGQSGIHRADQEGAYHNTKGQYNPWSGPSQQHLYQSKTHSNREHSGQNLQELPQNGQVNIHATERSKIHGTRQNNQNLNQQSAFPRKGVQSPESYQSQQQNNQRLKHQNFGKSGVQRAGQEAVHHNTEVHYNSRSASSQQNLYKSQQPENITGAVGLQSNHQVSLASQIISDYRSGQSQDFAGQPFKQITGLPRASSKLLAPYPLHQSDQTKGSKGTHYTEQASIQPHLHNKSKTERLTTKLPNEVHNQYPTNLAPQNLNDARGIHPKGHFVSQQNINAKYQAEKVITNLSTTQVVQNAPYNSHDQAGSRTQNNEPFYMQEVIKGQIQFEKLTTLLPEPKHSKGSPYLSTVDMHGLSGVAGQEQISGQNVAQFAPIVESARLTKGQQGVVHPESNTNTHHDPQNTYISSKETQMEQNIGNFGKQKGKLANKNSSSHSEGSKNITVQSGTLKPGLKKASVNLIDKSQPQISKRDKSVKTARQTRLPDIKQYVTKTSRAPKYDALASKTLVLGPDKTNPIQEGILRAKINYPHSSDAQTSKSPSATRKRQKTETNVLSSQVKRQSKPLSVEHIPNVSRADIAQPGVIGKQSHSHGSEVFIPRTKNSFNTQVPNTTPVYVDTEVLFELNESRRMKGLPPLKKEQVDINGNILPGKPSPNIPLETAHAPTSNQHQAKGHGNPPANQIRANGDLNARLDALISLLYVQRFTHEAPPKFVITKSVINTTKDPYADLKKTDPEAYLEIMESKGETALCIMGQAHVKAAIRERLNKFAGNFPKFTARDLTAPCSSYKPRRSMMLRVAFIGFGWMNPSHSCAKMPNDLCIIKLMQLEVKSEIYETKGRCERIDSNVWSQWGRCLQYIENDVDGICKASMPGVLILTHNHTMPTFDAPEKEAF